MTTDVLPESVAPAHEGEPPARHSANDGGDGRRRFFRSCTKGGLLALVPVVALLLMNGVNFLSDSFTTRFYASQARSLISGTWAMPRDRLSFEAFQHGGRYYMYYGPFPALLRIPLVHLLPTLAERTTQIAILVATAIALVCSARIMWHVRELVRGDRAVSRQERRWVAVFVFVVGAGSALTFLTSQAWVYHEAEAWGCALAIASFDAILAWLRRPSRTALVVASACAWASVLSRASVGFGPIGALGLLMIAAVWPRVRRLAGVAIDATRRQAVGLAAATLVPAVSYCYVNYAKFGNLFVFPTSAQEMSQLNPGRKYFLAHSGGSYFSLKFIPTTLLQYFRPDALRLSSLLPFLDFPNRPRVVGNVVFDALEPSSSAPSSMPFLFVLTCVALVVVFRRHRPGRGTESGNGFATARIPLVAAAIGSVSVLPFGYVAQRYLSDFVPLLVLGGAVGLQAALRWSEDRTAAEAVGTVKPLRRWRRPGTVMAVLGVLAVVSVVVNIALAVDYHYVSEWVPQEVSAPFVALQYRIHDTFPGGAAPHVERGARLPAHPGPRGTVFVVGKCEGVYWSPGNVNELAWGPWQGVARSTAAGEYKLKVRFGPTGGRRVIEPIVVRGTPGRLQIVSAFVGPGNTVNFAFSTQGHDDLPLSNISQGFYVGQIEHIRYDRTYDLTVLMDPNNGHVSVLFRGDTVFRMIQFSLTPEQNGSLVFPTDVVHIGANPYDQTTAPKFLGTIDEHKLGRPGLCSVLDG